MKRSVIDLLALQKVDLRIRELENKYKAIPGERAELVAEFDVVKKALAKAENAVRQNELKIRTLETDIASKKAHLQDIKIKSGGIKKMSEYNIVMNEIGSVSLQIQNMEEQDLVLMEEQEKLKAEAEKAGRNYRAVGRSVQKEVRELDAMKQEILKEITERTKESKDLEKNVPQSQIPYYKRLLQGGKGEPLGQITEAGLCSNCSLKLPPMTLTKAKTGDAVICDNCSCLLYDPES